MTTYLISYDLIRQKNYPKLWDALKYIGAKKILESVYLVELTSTAQELLQWIKQFVDNDDKILVSPVVKEHIVATNI